MWAGVAGGMAEYFDLDPSLVRLLWVAAALISGGLAVPIYILAWIILPRDDRPPVQGVGGLHDWSHEFHAETQRLAEEARRRAAEHHVAYHAEPQEPTPTAWTAAPPEPPHPYPNHRRHPRSAGIVLVGLGVLLLAANAGIFNFVEWKTMWPLIFIGLGVLLLARQADWGR